MQPLLGFKSRLHHFVGIKRVTLVLFNADQLEENRFGVQEQY